MSSGKQPMSNGSYDRSWNGEGSSSGGNNNIDGGGANTNGNGNNPKVGALLAAGPRLSIQEDDELPSYDDANSIQSGKTRTPSIHRQEVGTQIYDALEFEYAFEGANSHKELVTSVVRHPGSKNTILSIQRLGIGPQRPTLGNPSVFKLDAVPLPAGQLEVKASSEMGIRSIKIGMLDILEDEPDLQFGTIDWWDKRTASITVGTNLEHRFFDRPYSLPPDILMFLTGFAFKGGSPRRITATVGGIGQQGFLPKFLTGPNNTGVLDVRANWISVPKDHPRFDAGTFEVPPKSSSQHMHFMGTVCFTRWKFPKKQPPKVFVGFAGFDEEAARSFRFSVAVTGVSHKGFSWSVRNWDDVSFNYHWSAVISWIAIANPDQSL
ncbi:hypothetical protein TWF694_000281 [Orbilia ellipsospora]|uniref:H-type lectin domain-containing protein n=1 Tax=Orbilia ellipsospora TaxID=2528407 RepID=A0AAV9XN46_9PEZI